MFELQPEYVFSVKCTFPNITGHLFSHSKKVLRMQINTLPGSMLINNKCVLSGVLKTRCVYHLTGCFFFFVHFDKVKTNSRLCSSGSYKNTNCIKYSSRNTVFRINFTLADEIFNLFEFDIVTITIFSKV